MLCMGIPGKPCFGRLATTFIRVLVVDMSLSGFAADQSCDGWASSSGSISLLTGGIGTRAGRLPQNRFHLFKWKKTLWLFCFACTKLFLSNETDPRLMDTHFDGNVPYDRVVDRSYTILLYHSFSFQESFRNDLLWWTSCWRTQRKTWWLA